MTKFFLVLIGLWVNSASAFIYPCYNLNMYLREETNFFDTQIQNGQILTQGKVKYNGTIFYTQKTGNLQWDENLRACVQEGYFTVAYYGAFGRVHYCNYPIREYLREKITGEGLILGQISPSEIQPGPGCGMLGWSDRKWNMYKIAD